MSSEPIDRVQVGDTILWYGALGLVQFLIGAGLLTCPILSIAKTGDDQVSSGHIFALAVMVMIQGTMHILVYVKGRKLLSDSSASTPSTAANPLCCYTMIGIYIAFPEFATTLVTFVITGLFHSSIEDEINQKLSLAILIFTGIALAANIATIAMGCSRGKYIGVNLQNRNRQVRTQATWNTTTAGQQHGHGSNTATDTNAMIQNIHLQNALLQQQMLQQQQQQQQQQQGLANQQRFTNYGFQGAQNTPYSTPSAPSGLYTDGLDPAYPSGFAQPSGPPPPYQPK